MIVHNIATSGFATYPKCARQFPQRGLILLTGANGAGKSSLYEMVSWLVHGETVRQSAVAEAKGEITFAARNEVYRVKRARTKRSHKLTLECGPLDLGGATPSETQRRIDEIVGSHEQFRAATFFARDLLAKFALATDKQRKALLEEALGLQQFDRALAVATAHKQIARGELAVADAKLPLLGQRAAEQKERLVALRAKEMRPLHEVEDDIAALGDEPEKGGSDAALAKLHDEAKAAYEAAVVAKNAFDTNKARADRICRELQQQSEGCQACGRPYDAATVEVVVADLEQQLKQLGDCGQRAALQAKVRFATLSEEEGERTALAQARSEEHRRWYGRKVQLEAELKLAASHAEQVTALEFQFSKADGDLASAKIERDAAARVVRLREAACEALGLRGARCLLLGRALARLEHEANVVLGQVHPVMRLQLSGTDKLANGKEVDAVAVKVTGVGDGTYQSCSTSQRVLVDVALMMGLAAMRSGDGLLVFDEVFDSLDPHYVERVAGYLQGIARERQVLVISHHDQARSMFRHVACWQAKLDADGLSYIEDA